MTGQLGLPWRANTPSTGNYRKVQTILNVGAFDAQTGANFATSGHVYFPTRRSVFAPADVPNDSIDQNCDGFDNI